MTWIYRHAIDTTASDIIYSTSVTGNSCNTTVHFTLGNDLTLSGGHVISDNNDGCTETCGSGDGLCEISSNQTNQTLNTNEWYHVAMVSNNIYGLTIYKNGVSAATMVAGDWTNTLMDLRGMTSTTKTLFNSAYASGLFVYDDARIYNGVVRALHVLLFTRAGGASCAQRERTRRLNLEEFIASF
jgi:hypothetical protein